MAHAVNVPSVQPHIDACQASSIAQRPIGEQLDWMAAWSTHDDRVSSNNRGRMLERFACLAEKGSMYVKLHPTSANEYARYEMPGFAFGTLGLDGYASKLWASTDWETQRGFWKSLVGNMAMAAAWIDAALASGQPLPMNDDVTAALTRARKWSDTLVECAEGRLVEPPALLDRDGDSLRVIAPSGTRKRAPSTPRTDKAAKAAKGQGISPAAKDATLDEAPQSPGDVPADGTWLELDDPVDGKRTWQVTKGIVKAKRLFKKYTRDFLENYSRFSVKIVGDIVASSEVKI